MFRFNILNDLKNLVDSISESYFAGEFRTGWSETALVGYLWQWGSKLSWTGYKQWYLEIYTVGPPSPYDGIDAGPSTSKQINELKEFKRRICSGRKPAKKDILQDPPYAHASWW